MRLIIILLTIFLYSCGNNSVKTEKSTGETSTSDANLLAEKQKITPGELIPKVNCISNSAYSFALYVPQQFDTTKKYPLMVIFDAHADGVLPLHNYKELADKYHYILIGSNDSKNGNDQQTTSAIISDLLNSAKQILPVDEKRIYAGGFSGGGRVASMMSFGNVVSGLVTCGAGIPPNAWTRLPPFCVVGIAGDGDMNLSEVAQAQINVTEIRNRFYSVRFDGKHEWPPQSIFEEAFLAFESTAMRDGLQQKSPEQIKMIDNTYRKITNDHLAKKKILFAASAYKRWMKSLESLADISNIKKDYDSFILKPEYKKAVETEKSLFAEENKRRDFYIAAFGKADTSWWVNEMNNIHREMKSVTAEKRNMLSRVTGTLSLATYMNLNKALNSGQKDAIAYLSTLYRAIDPENPEAWYISAKYAASYGNNDLALVDLKQAVNTGFKDAGRINNEQVFIPLRNEEQFKNLINRISN